MCSVCTVRSVAAALRAQNVALVDKETAAHHGSVALVADETVAVPVTLFKRNELGASKACTTDIFCIKHKLIIFCSGLIKLLSLLPCYY